MSPGLDLDLVQGWPRAVCVAIAVPLRSSTIFPQRDRDQFARWGTFDTWLQATRGNDAELGYVEVEGDVAGILQGTVGALTHNGVADAEREAYQQAQDATAADVGFVGTAGRFGDVDYPDIAGTESGGDAGFFQLLEQGL